MSVNQLAILGSRSFSRSKIQSQKPTYSLISLPGSSPSHGISVSVNQEITFSSMGGSDSVIQLQSFLPSSISFAGSSLKNSTILSQFLMISGTTVMRRKMAPIGPPTSPSMLLPMAFSAMPALVAAAPILLSAPVFALSVGMPPATAACAVFDPPAMSPSSLAAALLLSVTPSRVLFFWWSMIICFCSSLRARPEPEMSALNGFPPARRVLNAVPIIPSFLNSISTLPAIAWNTNFPAMPNSPIASVMPLIVPSTPSIFWPISLPKILLRISKPFESTSKNVWIAPELVMISTNLPTCSRNLAKFGPAFKLSAPICSKIGTSGRSASSVLPRFGSAPRRRNALRMSPMSPDSEVKFLAESMKNFCSIGWFSGAFINFSNRSVASFIVFSK